MKRLVAIVALALACGGCMNCYFRAPWTRGKIEECYQSTRYMGGMTMIASFPQMMSDCPGDGGFRWENCFTIPFLGLPCFVDTACELCLDTAFLPADYFIARAREKKD